ncbi:hypothetical protein ES703_29905 [subsurface metagenome]
MIGDGQSGHAIVSGSLHQVFQATGTVQEAILGMDMKMNEVGMLNHFDTSCFQLLLYQKLNSIASPFFTFFPRKRKTRFLSEVKGFLIFERSEKRDNLLGSFSFCVFQLIEFRSYRNEIFDKCQIF